MGDVWRFLKAPTLPSRKDWLIWGDHLQTIGDPHAVELAQLTARDDWGLCDPNDPPHRLLFHGLSERVWPLSVWAEDHLDARGWVLSLLDGILRVALFPMFEAQGIREIWWNDEAWPLADHGADLHQLPDRKAKARVMGSLTLAFQASLGHFVREGMSHARFLSVRLELERYQRRLAQIYAKSGDVRMAPLRPDFWRADNLWGRTLALFSMLPWHVRCAILVEIFGAHLPREVIR